MSNGTTNVDSVTDFRDYIVAAKECGMTALGISEHGNIFEWLHKKEEIERAGLKYLHCVEAYLTEDDDNSYEYESGEKVWQKTKDNYHCVLIAKNYEGFKELNRLASKSFCRTDEHFYYIPRITFDELFATSDNIFVTSACLGGPLNKGVSSAKEKMLAFFIRNKHRCYLEIQHHNCDEQKQYNQMLLKLHKRYNIPLIVGTDTHALNDDHLFVRSVLQAAKGVHFEDEDNWDLVFKSPHDLIEAYKAQEVVPMEYVLMGMQSTIELSDRVDTFTIDRSAKYPKLYDDSETVFKKKVNQGYIDRGISLKPNKDEYIKRIRSEYETYEHNGAIDFMLLEEDYKSEMRKRGVKFGYSRGSVSGSVIAYLLGITEMDSVKYDLNFERFMNKERVSLAD